MPPPELAALASELNPVPPDGGNALPRQRRGSVGLWRRRPDSAWPKRSGGNHLVTDYINDYQGRPVRVLHRWIEIDPRTIGLPAAPEHPHPGCIATNLLGPACPCR